MKARMQNFTFGLLGMALATLTGFVAEIPGISEGRVRVVKPREADDSLEFQVTGKPARDLINLFGLQTTQNLDIPQISPVEKKNIYCEFDDEKRGEDSWICTFSVAADGSIKRAPNAPSLETPRIPTVRLPEGTEEDPQDPILPSKRKP